jgi:hypothetical protein
MIPLTEKLQKITALLRRVLEMEEALPGKSWAVSGGDYDVFISDGETIIAQTGMPFHEDKDVAAFIALTRNITKPQATALLLAIEALERTERGCSFPADEVQRAVVKTMRDALQSIADTFPDDLFAGEHTP